MADEPKKLTNKQQRFVEEYTVDFNATQAAIRSGYSYATAAVIGCENLIKPNIKAAISVRVAKLTMTADEAMIRMSDFARGSFQPFLKVSDNNDILIDLTTDDAKNNIRLIKKMKQTKRIVMESMIEVVTEIEIHDAKDAVGKMLQVHGKGIDRNVNIKGKIEDLTELQLNKLIDSILEQQSNE